MKFAVHRKIHNQIERQSEAMERICKIADLLHCAPDAPRDIFHAKLEQLFAIAGNNS